MLLKKEHIGLALNGEAIKIVSATISGKKVVLDRFESLQLVNQIDEVESGRANQLPASESEDSDDIFGISGEPKAQMEPSGTEELNLDDIDLFEEEQQPIDLVDEADQPETNELLLYNYLISTGKNKRKTHVGLNILAGNTNFQIIRGDDYSKLKKKDLNELISDRLETVYGLQPSTDRFSHTVREDGTLIIASIDREPSLLSLVNRVNDLSNDKVVIDEMISDEVALTGLYRINYDSNDHAITGLIQLGVNQSRIIFFKGHDVLQVSPVINEGVSNKSYLRTIFSKILFQLDSGEIPGIDRLILADNSEGEKATAYFSKNFPDISVSEFELNPDRFEIPETADTNVGKYTTAVAIAVKASGYEPSAFPALSLLPDYVIERQKIFKLEWHGIALLIAIGLSPIIINYFYQANLERINYLQNESERYEALTNSITPVVTATEALETRLSEQQAQISLLNELVQGNIRWTTILDHFSETSIFTGDNWYTVLREGENDITIEGYSLYEERIPVIARRFSSSTLRTVRRELIRDRDIFYFLLSIDEVFSNDSLYTPENMRDLEEILQINPR